MTSRNLFYPLVMALVLPWVAAGCATTGTGGTTSAGTQTTNGAVAGGATTSGSGFGNGPTAATADPSYAPQTFPYARASITIIGNPGDLDIPNDGETRVLAYSWGGGRPRIVPQQADSLGAPLQIPGGTPTLNIQKREDILSPLLQQLFEQQIPINRIRFTIDPETAPETIYNLYGVTIASMRTVGPQTSPATEELVLVFGRIEQEPVNR